MIKLFKKVYKIRKMEYNHILERLKKETQDEFLELGDALTIENIIKLIEIMLEENKKWTKNYRRLKNKLKKCH